MNGLCQVGTAMGRLAFPILELTGQVHSAGAECNATNEPKSQ